MERCRKKKDGVVSRTSGPIGSVLLEVAVSRMQKSFISRRNWVVRLPVHILCEFLKRKANKNFKMLYRPRKKVGVSLSPQAYVPTTCYGNMYYGAPDLGNPSIDVTTGERWGKGTPCAKAGSGFCKHHPLT